MSLVAGIRYSAGANVQTQASCNPKCQRIIDGTPTFAARATSSTPMAAPAVFEPLERVGCRPLSGRPTPPARRVKRQAVSSPIHSHAAYWCEFESTAVIAFDLAINEYGLLRAPTGPGQLPTVRASVERQSAGRGTPNNIGACWVK